MPRRESREETVAFAALIPATGFVAVYWDRDNADPEAPLICIPVIAWAARIVHEVYLKVYLKTNEEVADSRRAEVSAMICSEEMCELEPACELENLLGVCEIGRERELFAASARDHVAQHLKTKQPPSDQQS